MSERIQTVGRVAVQVRRPRGRPVQPQTTGLRQRAWWLMRALPRFTMDELLLTVAEGAEKDAPSNLQKYISALERVGVVTRLKRRHPGATPTSNGHVIWRLANDLGRKAPVWRSKTQVLYDPNSGALLPVVNADREPHGLQGPDDKGPAS